MEGENTIQRSRIGSGEWLIVLTFLGTIDLIQIILDFFAIGILVNRVIDVFVGGAFLIYLFLRGEFRNHQTRNRILLAFFATFVVEMIPILDIAPAWILDGLYCRSQSKKTNEMAAIQEKNQIQAINQNMIEAQQVQQMRIMEIRERQGIEAGMQDEARKELILKKIAQSEAQKQKQRNNIVQR